MTEAIYKRGTPLRIDLDRLEKAFGIPYEGLFISHDQLEAVTECDRKSYRYRTIIARWRKELLRRHNILLVSRFAEGYVVADPSGRVRWASGKSDAATRAINRAAAVASTTDHTRLDAVQLAAVEHMTALAAKVVSHGRPMVEPPRPTQAIERRVRN